VAKKKAGSDRVEVLGLDQPSAFSPGEYIKDEIRARRWTIEVFTKAMELSPEDVFALLGGRMVINEPIALKLAEAFGTSWELWAKLQVHFEAMQLLGQLAAETRRGEAKAKVAAGRIRRSRTT
jgi:plasmid maintenance system antidote protein VapI